MSLIYANMHHNYHVAKVHHPGEIVSTKWHSVIPHTHARCAGRGALNVNVHFTHARGWFCLWLGFHS